MSRFEHTYCSQCGGEFGPGDEGFSHCSDHARTDCIPVPTDRNQGWPGVYAVLYTDVINDEQTCRDDLWIATTTAITNAIDKAQTKAYAEGRKDEAESGDWQPIATAPKDGTPILIYASGEVHAGYWAGDGGGAKVDVADDTYPWLVFYKGTGGLNAYMTDKPTHWMPLPTAPTA